MVVPTDEPIERYTRNRLNNHHDRMERKHGSSSSRNSSHTHSSGGGRTRRGSGADSRFGEFPPQQLTAAAAAAGSGAATKTPEITTPQTSNKRAAEPQSKIRFAEDTKLSPIRSNRVLVLEQNAPSSSSAPQQPFASEDVTSLDFSMIATPGGKLARMVDNDRVYTPSDASTNTAASSNGRSWTAGTPFSSILRGVVSSTPSINPRQILNSSATPYTAARESLTQQQQSTPNVGDHNGNNNNANNNECTALMFARSAPLSGYLRKLGKNIPTFKRRFFVLKPSTHLYYFISPHDVEPRGCIDLDMVRDDNGEGDGCEVREIGSFPDGTFRFELLFDEEAAATTAEEEDGSSSAMEDTASDTGSRTSQNSKRRHFQRQSIVMEARTEEIGREWMAKLQSERLSTVRDEADFLRTNLAEMKSISARWENSACEEAMRADEAERQRNTAISEAKSWEGKFTDLNEAIRLLVKNSKQGGSASSSVFEEEAFAGLDVNGTNFSEISEMYKLMSKREGEAKERIAELEKLSQLAISRAAKAEAELAKLWDDNRTMQHDLKKTRREKKILVKEVRSLHAAVEENAQKQPAHHYYDPSERHTDHKHHDLHSTNSQSESRGGASDSASIARPKRKLNEEEKRLVIELEEHVMSGLRLSEQFLTLNGVDPSEVGDDLDNSVQTSKASIDKSPDRQSNYRLPQKAQSDISPRQTYKTANETLQQHVGNPLGSLLDENDDESEVALVSADAESTLPDNANREIDHNSDVNGADTSFVAESIQGSDLLNDAYQYEEASSGDHVNQNLNDRFREQMHIDSPGGMKSISNQHQDMQSTLNTEESSDGRAPHSLDVASSVSESSRSRVTDNGHATAKLECPLRDVGETPHPHRSKSTLGDDGKVYHITFYSSKIGLQFQKVPNETKSSGLLTDAMTADHGPNVETNQTAAELRRIASISQRSHRKHQGGQATECFPVIPGDAVLVCGFVGFDDSTGNVRPRIGARLVAFDGIPVEVGKWTFESIRKSIQARGRPLTLSFRNDFLTPKQREILTKAVQDVTPSNQSVAHSQIFRGSVPARERNPDYQNTIYTSTSSISSQRSQPKDRYYSFSEAGSSISSAVAPLMLNLLSNKRSSGKQQDNFAPDYLKRTSDSLDKMRHHHDFQSGLL